MKPVAFSPAAEADLGEIWDYIAYRWGPDKADNYTDAIRNACYALARGTKHGRPVEVLPDFQKYLCGSQMVYFLNYPSHLNVIRILHQRQDADRHLYPEHSTRSPGHVAHVCGRAERGPWPQSRPRPLLMPKPKTPKLRASSDTHRTR